LACGTGATAAALLYAARKHMTQGEVSLKALGGELSVGFQMLEGKATNVVLAGPAQHVFDGKIQL